MYRTSSYTIYVDLPDNDRDMLLVHGYTGAYDKVSRPVAEFLRAHEAGRPPKPLYGSWATPPIPGAAPLPSEETLAVLERRGYLTSLSSDEEETVFERLATGLHEQAIQRPPSYIFMPTYDCNLRCGYCFQDEFRTDCGFKHLLQTMRPRMVDRIFKAIPAIEARHGVTGEGALRRSIGFFGGEPLLAANREIVERIMERALDLGDADFWAVTNGTELGAYLDLLGPAGILRLQITLDGPPEEHDGRRIYPDGSGSFERIADNISRALERGALVNARVNVDRGNLQDLPRLAEEVVARGWHRQRGFSLYAAPIHASNDQTERKTTLSSWQLDRELKKMQADSPVMALVGRPDEGIRSRARQIFDRDHDLLPRMRPSFCGAHDQMYIFDPFGDVYACWERTGDPKIRIAHVTTDGDIEYQYEQTRQWRSRSVASNPVCRRCRYALHCGGGCAILALGQRGTMHANHCDGFASRFRSSVAEAYSAHVAGDEVAERLERVCDL